MILGEETIRKRLHAGQIFKEDTWREDSIKEASYALRIAGDGLLVDGTFYDPGTPYKDDYIEIEPGKIAILSTIERIHMPADLVGTIGIRLKYALQGLIGLMGIQVDPLYGHDKACERLFIRVANFGNESIRLSPGDEVFTFELQEVCGSISIAPKEGTWTRIKDALKSQSDLSWSYVTWVEQDLSAQTENIRENLQPVVMFGVFLVAVTILGVVIATLLQLPDPPEVKAASWLSEWEQILLLGVLTLGALGTAWIGFTAGFRFLRPYRISRPKLRRRRARKLWQAIGSLRSKWGD